jgi:1-hydroxy-2-methyl-2-(E)-butenyl 4-diphosphate synthase
MDILYDFIKYERLATKEVKIGNLVLGNYHPIRIQTMTTTDTMDTIATVEQSIRCIEAGAELVRITAPSKKEAENLLHIKNELHRRGYKTPLVADIHFTPNAAEIAARIVEKVRVNPGNYVDKKKFELIEYTDSDYFEEIDRIRERFTPLVRICKVYGTAMRIGTNHGSLSDRIMSRYGDTPIGMVESAMEFLRIARAESYHNIVLSMKSSNPKVMVQAYRLLVKIMQDEFGECYPLHLGVTEAGDGEDGRVKSAVGIGALLEDGIGDTIRVSLTEDPEFEIPVCRDIVKRYSPSPTIPFVAQDAAKAPSRGEGEKEFEYQLPDLFDSLEEETVGYRFADPSLYGILKEYAHNHRAQPTQAEEVLWEMLKTKRIHDFKFRRHHIIDRYITDFVCLKKRLVIEIDGLIHQLPENAESDEQRTHNLNKSGFTVIRFTNEEVISTPEIVLQTILKKLEHLPDIKSINKTNREVRKTSLIQSLPDLSSPTGGQGALGQVPVVIADLSKLPEITAKNLESVGYKYEEALDKWTISDTAADYIFTGHHKVDFALPGTLKVIVYPATWLEVTTTALLNNDEVQNKFFPIFDSAGYVGAELKSSELNFVMVDCFNDDTPINDFTHLDELANDPKVVLCLSSTNKNAMQSIRRMFLELRKRNIKNPVIIIIDSNWKTADEHLIHYATEAGALLLDNMGDGVCFGMTLESYQNSSFNNQQQFLNSSGRNYSPSQSIEHFINNTAFSILQATRKRISKTEYISCPSCGRTLFDLQETTAKIRAVTNHLKGVKIAIMGCIVNGPGEMADADFGYVGSGPGKITLYRGKEVIKRNVPSEIAVEELINLLKENGAWVEKELIPV